MAVEQRRMTDQSQCAHERIELRLFCPQCDNEFESRQLTRAEFEAKAVDLPGREAMSLVNANIAIPINLAAALNILSDSSTAAAIADQTTPIQQGI